MFSIEIDNLIEIIKEYPGISKKQATKIIKYIIDKKGIDNFKYEINKFINILENVKKCKICSYYSLSALCNICSSENRDKKLMIIENLEQIENYEEWKIYNGKYYLIPSLFNSKGEQINYDFSFLKKYVQEFNEIIIAISPTAQGVMTSNLIFDTIKKAYPKILISKFAIGIPLGSSIEYIDKLTISYAYKNRKDIE